MSQGSDAATREAGIVRPYLITGGRTTSTEADLPVEAIVVTTTGADTTVLTFERKAIVEHCTEPQSIAELASELDLPLGVTRVLVSDMNAEGLLRTRAQADRTDAALIKQLIEGIRAL